MITKIIPKPGSSMEKILFCDALYLDEMPNPNIVPLFGPNGIGKSSIIKQLLNASNGKNTSIEVERTRTDMRVMSYCDRLDNCRTRDPRDYMEAFDPNYLSDRFNADAVSEGQSIIYSMIALLDIIGTGKQAIYGENGEETLVIMDEIDSGISLDNLDMIMRKLKNTAKKRKDVQVIFSFNNPYVVRYFPDVMSLYSGHPIRLETPDDMLAEIKSHEKEFRKKRYKSNGMPRIFK